ncbi:MAG: hypothetical protein R2824_16610 [Saprospiraceae bacterium]
MIKRDYILRWTKELAKVIARLLGKDPDLQLEIIREVYSDLLELEPDTLDPLPLEEIIPYLTRQKAYNEGQLEFLAEILFREGNLHLDQSQIHTGRRRLQEALLIFEFLDARQDIYSLERQHQMDAIRTTLDH